MPILELIFQVCVSVEYHQAALALQVSHELRHAVLWRYTDQHVDMIAHQMSFYDFHTFVIAQLPQYFSYAFLVLSVYCFSSVFWCKYYMVFAQPFCMAQRVSYICHSAFLLGVLQ